MKRKIAVLMMVLALVVTFMPVNASAASKTKKMKAYDQVCISGQTAYCATVNGIYKVKLSKSGKAIGKRLLLKDPFGNTGFVHFSEMKVKGKYLYLHVFNEAATHGIARINVKTGKKKDLAVMDDDFEYVIDGNKIYYKTIYSSKVKKKVMKLNGSSKRKTSAKISLKSKKSKKGYSIIETHKGANVTIWLKTPKGKKRLGSYVDYEYDEE